MLDAKDSKSFQFRAFAICSISHPERRAKIAVFILSTSENNIVLSGEIIPIEFRTRNLRRSLATSKLLMSDIGLNWLRVFFLRLRVTPLILSLDARKIINTRCFK